MRVCAFAAASVAANAQGVVAVGQGLVPRLGELGRVRFAGLGLGFLAAAEHHQCLLPVLPGRALGGQERVVGR
ncbi:hypothetical protein [Streptomyces sp. CC210A]|uniref:hypothetical protein n=1 Tax=Streptomyces sp. CC210A TaxID=2898184 RepID=UPI001F212BA6|nr:hypothetical protein [Streptomyces sp. CC210A]